MWAVPYFWYTYITMKKVILISGGSDGLGKAIAKKLVATHAVIILASNKEKTASAAEAVGCDFAVADVSSYEQVENVVSEIVTKYGQIDCLVNNAGVWIEGPLEDNSPEDITKVLDVNTKGTIFLTKAVLPYMKKQNSGRIVNVISQSGLHSKAERTVYHASKWAITGFTDSLRIELATNNISVCGFYPGGMKTDFFAKAGSTKDVSKYIELDDAVSALEFIVNAPESVCIPEFGIKFRGA